MRKSAHRHDSLGANLGIGIIQRGTRAFRYSFSFGAISRSTKIAARRNGAGRSGCRSPSSFLAVASAMSVKRDASWFSGPGTLARFVQSRARVPGPLSL